MAFPLMAIGAGIGRFADSLMEQRRQQQEQAMQRLRMQFEMQRFAQELGLKKEQLGLGQLGAALSNPFGGGGTGFGAPGGSGGSNAGLGMGPVPGAPSSFTPPPNVSSGSTFSPTEFAGGYYNGSVRPGHWMGGAPYPDVSLPPGVFGGAYSDTGTRSGGREGASPQSRMPATPDAAAGLTPGPGDPRAMLPFIRGDAARYGVDPDVAERVARSEGLGSFAGDSGTSFGAFQLHRGGGLGDTFQRQTGLDPSNPQNEPATIDFALRNAASTGWSPYHGAARVGVGPRQGIGGDTQVAQANTGTMSDAGPQLPPLPPPPNPQQIYQQTLTDAQRYGLNPNTPIGQALISKGAMDRYKAQMTMWQGQKAQWEAQKAAVDEQRLSRREQRETESAALAHRADLTLPDGTVVVGIEGRPDTFTTRSGHKLSPEQVGQLDRAQRAAGAGRAGGGLEQSKTLQVLDDKGNVVRTVLARERRDQAGWLDSQTGKPIELRAGQSLKQVTPGNATGGRAGAQVLRQEIGGREVLSDLQNAVSLPVGTTIGPLGTVVPGTSVIGALHGDLVRKLTDQDSQLMQASMASMTRELSILMSPVYGGNYAAQQIEPLVPKSGDTLGTVMFKLARLAQSSDNALEAISKSPLLSNDQQQYARDLRGEIQKAIPWTAQQALSFAQEGRDPGQSFSDFMKGHTPGGGAPSPASNAPPTGAIEELKGNPSPQRRQQFDEVFGQGAAARALGQ